ncbi:MAG: polysaccharide deacetylase family protein, partial [Kiritimatiellia bacterium]|nr:polysaccharide deacetylase family protein [Kiritimatiellia bacterium]
MSTNPDPSVREPGDPAPLSQDSGSVRSRPPEEVSYFIPWMIFLMILAIAVAWFVPAKALVERIIWRPVESGPRTSGSFVALAYRGISDKPLEVDEARFRDHLQALRRAGYKPITLREVQALYREGRLLPEKAVLLTFEHGRRSSYFSVKRVLQRSGWNAVMFLWVQAIENQDPAALRWPYVRNLARSRNWEIAAQSYDGFSRVLAGPSGQEGNYLTSPVWMPADERHETLVEFQDRLRADHEKSIRLIDQKIGAPPIAFAYPRGDFGQYQSKAMMIRAINQALAARYYPLAFLSGNLALNTRFSDPHRLNRLLVRSSWTGEDLVAFLDRSWPKRDSLLPEEDVDSKAWIVDWGRLDQEQDGGVHLRAAEETTGAKAWIAGSNLKRDFHSRVSFRLESGQFGLFFRASPDGESFIYLGLEAVPTAEGEADAARAESSAGQVWLRQKEIGGERFTLGSAEVRLISGQEHTLDVYVRENLFFALLDGKPVFPNGVQLHGLPTPGMVGVSVWAPRVGMAAARIPRASVAEQRSALAAWTVTPEQEGPSIAWIHRNAHRL